MNTIKFSHDYKKLPLGWEGTQALLLSVTICTIKELSRKYPLLLEKDTKFRGEEGYYELNFEVGILLIFWHLNTNEFFTTIRRYTDEKCDYYRCDILKTFMLVKEE